MQRWVLERNGLVRAYLLTEGEPTEEQKRRRAFGGDGEGDLAAEGTWRLVPLGPALVGDDWTYDGVSYAPPQRQRNPACAGCNAGWRRFLTR